MQTLVTTPFMDCKAYQGEFNKLVGRNVFKDILGVTTRVALEAALAAVDAVTESEEQQRHSFGTLYTHGAGQRARQWWVEASQSVREGMFDRAARLVSRRLEKHTLAFQGAVVKTTFWKSLVSSQIWFFVDQAVTDQSRYIGEVIAEYQTQLPLPSIAISDRGTSSMTLLVFP